MNNKTIEYYNTNAESFISSTVNANISTMLKSFLDEVPEHATILDWGCGSGRDSYAMLQAGYQVTSIDLSEAMIRATEQLTGHPAIHQSFFDLDECEAYDGIWACSSLLHIEKDKLATLFTKAAHALKDNGAFYISFKYGDFEGMRNGRYFTDLTEESLQTILQQVPTLVVHSQWISGDVRPGRENEKWLNAILKKVS